VERKDQSQRDTWQWREVMNHGNLVGRSRGVVRTRWWGLGILSLAPIVLRSLEERKRAMGGTLDDMNGRIKEAGELTDDEGLKREGKVDQMAGKVKGKGTSGEGGG
jgi:uncharacterized protein YjbJ (UPF0337 family)